jgi:glycosyltransferase involved in cell wall biosynthesis
LFLLPSWQESFGLAALEAMACGVPVVASSVGGLPEVVEDGVSGFLRAPEDASGMAEASIQLLTNEELHRKFSKAGLDRVRRHFCAKLVVPQYEAYYQQVLDS